MYSKHSQEVKKTKLNSFGEQDFPGFKHNKAEIEYHITWEDGQRKTTSQMEKAQMQATKKRWRTKEGL